MRNHETYSKTQLIFGEHAMLKVIEDPDGIRLKICPKVHTVTETTGTNRYDETEDAREITLSRREGNLAIRAMRITRNRLWGKDE